MFKSMDVEGRTACRLHVCKEKHNFVARTGAGEIGFDAFMNGMGDLLLGKSHSGGGGEVRLCAFAAARLPLIMGVQDPRDEYTAAEIEIIREIFDEVDEDRSGEIDIHELENILLSLNQVVPWPQTHRRR